MPFRAPSIRFRSFLIASLSAGLVGCAGVASTPSTGPQSAGAPRPTLAAEQRRMADLFRDTPVAFTMQPDGSMKVTVPLRYAFDKGRYAVKPPLAAVLDRVARSQRAEATRFLVAAPADPQSRGLMLATERATSARDYLVARGVDATRFSISANGGGDTVVIVVAEAAPH
jgi:outer membrane protein OmpA-like peptidoglycan-associated protein